MTNVHTYLDDLYVRRAQRRKIARTVTFIFAGAGLILGMTWLLFRSDLLRIHEIVIDGAARVSAAEVRTVLDGALRDRSLFVDVFGARHFFSWPEGQLANISATIPGISSIVLEKRYRDHAVIAHVEERIPLGIWCLSKTEPIRCFWFDDKGVAFEPSPEAYGNLIPTIFDSASDNLVLGHPVVVEPLWSGMRSVLLTLAETGLSIDLVRVESWQLQEVEVIVEDGPTLYFSLRFPAHAAASVLGTMIDEDRRGVLTPRFADIEYVDFRVQNKVFYK